MINCSTAIRSEKTNAAVFTPGGVSGEKTGRPVGALREDTGGEGMYQFVEPAGRSGRRGDLAGQHRMA